MYAMAWWWRRVARHVTWLAANLVADVTWRRDVTA